VRVRLSILDNTATGSVLYVETHLKTTNALGLFNLIIGQGTVVSGVFSALNWGTNAKFLKVEMDATGGTAFVLVGTTQLLTVPYAMYAASVGSIAGNAAINDELVENRTTNFAFVDSSDYKVYAYSIALASWSSQAFNQFASPALVASNGNFAFNDSSDNKIYVFNGKLAFGALNRTINLLAHP